MRTGRIIAPLLIAVFSAILFPSLVFAATFLSVVNKLINYLNLLILPIVGLGVLSLAYGIMRYLGAGGDTKRIGEAKSLIIWGLIGIFVMISVWGLVNLVVSTFFTSQDLRQTDLNGLYPQ